MLDLLEYAFHHNVSIEISPISRVPKVIDIKVRRGHHQISYFANLDSLEHSDEIIEEVLNVEVERLERRIREIKMMTSGECEVEYHE